MVSPLQKGWVYMGGVSAHMSRPHGNWESDNAIDMGDPPGTPVYAVEDGEIDPSLGFGFVEIKPYVWGYRLHLRGQGSNEYFYTHLGGYVRGLRPGTRVQEGQKIAWLGKPPSFPPHLHFASRPPQNPEHVAYARSPNPDVKDLLRARTGYWAWLQWYLGENRWKAYGPHNLSVRPDVPLKIPRAWWGRLAMLLAKR